MPVGRRELERWSQQQQQQNAGSGGAVAGLIRGAHGSGALNLTGKGLVSVPPELLGVCVSVLVCVCVCVCERAKERERERKRERARASE